MRHQIRNYSVSFVHLKFYDAILGTTQPQDETQNGF